MGILSSLAESYEPDIQKSPSNIIFIEGVDGLFQISADTEMAWNNIMVESLVKEHQASILHEDGLQLLEESAKEFKDKVIEWIKDKARKLREFFRNIKLRIMTAISSVKKFIDKRKESKAFSKFSGTVKLPQEINDWLNDSRIDEIAMSGSHFLKSTFDISQNNNGDSNMLYNLIGKGITSFDTSAIKEIKETYIKNGNGKTREIKADVFLRELLEEKAKLATKLLNTAEKETNAILAGMMKEAKESGDEKRILFQKRCSSFADSIIGIYVSLLLARMKDSMIIGKAVMDKVEKK